MEPPPPRLMLITLARGWPQGCPVATSQPDAQRMPLATVASLPLPPSLRTFPLRREQFCQSPQVPATPRLLPVLAATVPATWVPCPCLSSVPLVVLLLKFLLRVTL